MLRRLISTVENWIYSRRKPEPAGISNESYDESDRDLARAAFDEAVDALKRAKGPHQGKVHLLPAHWRMIYTLFTLDYEVRNGGFHQFFANAGGAFDGFLLDDVDFLADNEYSPIIKSAFKKYTGIDYTDQWENRGKSWDFFTAPYKQDQFHDEEKVYYKLMPGLPELLGQYIRQNFDQYKAE